MCSPLYNYINKPLWHNDGLNNVSALSMFDDLGIGKCQGLKFVIGCVGRCKYSRTQFAVDLDRYFDLIGFCQVFAVNGKT